MSYTFRKNLSVFKKKQLKIHDIFVLKNLVRFSIRQNDP